METLYLNNGRTVSLELRENVIKTGKVRFGYVNISSRNQYTKKYQLELMYDENDIEFENTIRTACKNAFKYALENKMIPEDSKLKDFINSPIKNVVLDKYREEDRELFTNKKVIKPANDFEVEVYNEYGKRINTNNVRLGNTGSVIFLIKAYSVGDTKGFKAYIRKVLVLEDELQKNTITFFDNGEPLEVLEENEPNIPF